MMTIKNLVQENCKEDSIVSLVINNEEIYEGKAKDIPEEYWYREGRMEMGVGKGIREIRMSLPEKQRIANALERIADSLEKIVDENYSYLEIDWED